MTSGWSTTTLKMSEYTAVNDGWKTSDDQKVSNIKGRKIVKESMIQRQILKYNMGSQFTEKEEDMMTGRESPLLFANVPLY